MMPTVDTLLYVCSVYLHNVVTTVKPSNREATIKLLEDAIRLWHHLAHTYIVHELILFEFGRL